MRSALFNFHFFFFNDTATTEIYTLSLHDALPILFAANDTMAIGCLFALTEAGVRVPHDIALAGFDDIPLARFVDRKSTRLNSSHSQISYAVFCLKKKTTIATSSPSTQQSTMSTHH